MEKKIIKLPCFGIVVELEDEDKELKGTFNGGNVTSDLKETPVDISDIQEIHCYNSAMDAIESLILGHACAGIDITTPAYIEGIESAVQGCVNNI